MKVYYKDGVRVERPKSLIFKGMTYVPPTDETLIEAGYVVVDEQPKPLTNDDIKMLRAIEYAERADKHLLAYQAYLELGEVDKATEMKNIWLQVRKDIDKELPYIEEQETQEEVVKVDEQPIVEDLVDDYDD